MAKYTQDINASLRELLLLNKRICAELLQREKDKQGSVLETRKCPVCGEEGHSKIINNGFFDFRRCSGCDLLYMSPALRDDIISESFTDKDIYNREYWLLMEKQMKQYDYQKAPDAERHPILRDIMPVKRSGRLLDIGCSIGNFLMAASHFFDVEGVEINLKTAELAKSRGLKIHTGPIEEIDGEQTYDVITMNQVFYGLKYPLQLIRNVARLLKKDGIIYINTPNADSLSMHFFSGEHCHVIGKTNMNVFNKRSLQKFAENSGLEIQKFYTEWLDLFLLDVATFFFARKKFIHKRNYFIPAYGECISFEEKLQCYFMGNHFKRIGDYCICILKRT